MRVSRNAITVATMAVGMVGLTGATHAQVRVAEFGPEFPSDAAGTKACASDKAHPGRRPPPTRPAHAGRYRRATVQE